MFTPVYVSPSFSPPRRSRLRYLSHEQPAEHRWLTFLFAAAYIGLLLTGLAVAIL